MALSKKAITRHAGVFKTREVHVPELADDNGDDVVLVRGMTLREFEINQSRNNDDGLATASVLVRCVLNPDGSRVFTDDDRRVVAELPMKATSKINQAIFEESGLADAKDGESAQDVAIADAEKNSEPTPTAEPSSSSPSDSGGQ